MVTHNEDWDEMDWTPSEEVQFDFEDDGQAEQKLKKMKLEDVKPTVRSKIESMKELFEMD
jgi:hypothetical protein